MLDLLDYRRRVHKMYLPIRTNGDDPSVWRAWQQERDDLFRTHPQSALDEAQRENFKPLRYFEHNPAFRVVAPLTDEVEPEVISLDLGNDGAFKMQRFASVTFSLPTGTGTLSVFWIMGYGGGIFIPFGDATNKVTTYGAGRYLVDTIKGADLGSQDGAMVLDFNYAYHPSCVYHYRWTCPLAPLENRLDFRIPVGEMLPDYSVQP
jgi:uncharacterized protein (DUF1684 family)